MSAEGRKKKEITGTHTHNFNDPVLSGYVRMLTLFSFRLSGRECSGIMIQSVVLNFDSSVIPLPSTLSLPLSNWQERIRYNCSLRDLDDLNTALTQHNLGVPRLTFLGSGDFHHVSYLLIKRMASQGPFQVIVFDNHPDNMRYPWGIHCGSWVRHVCRLPFVSRVMVVGITSRDIHWTHLWENYLRPLYSAKLFYFCLSPVSKVAILLGISGIREVRGGPQNIPDLVQTIAFESRQPVYISIDKDVLSPQIVETNWDQGAKPRRLQTPQPAVNTAIMGNGVFG